MKGISVIICCYNSSARLPETIKHISKQKISNDINWELIIVDNSSNDGTAEAAREILELYKFNSINSSIIPEMKAGLNNARYTGVKNAKYDYVVFCDDDNWLDELYLETSFNIIDGNPQIGALGGISVGVAECGIFPDWWEDFAKEYAVGKQATESGYVDVRGYVWGAGLVTRKNYYLKAYCSESSHLLSDRKGNELLSGGDTEYCKRLILMGFRLYYSSDLVLSHFMPQNRLNWQYRKKLYAGHVKSGEILDIYNKVIDSKKRKWYFKIWYLLLLPFLIVCHYTKILLLDKRVVFEQIFMDWGIAILPIREELKQVVEIDKSICK